MADTEGRGPSHATGYRARTPWSAGAAVLATGAMVLAALGFAAGVTFIDTVVRGGPRGHQSGLQWAMVMTCVMQLTIIAGVIWASSRWGGRTAEVLSLHVPLTAGMLGLGLAGMIAVLAPYNLAVYLASPENFTRDLRQFSDIARSSAAWIGLAVVGIGAPVSEEILFRGFLLSALAVSRVGFYGAALATTLAWTLLHWGYTVFGLIEVFLIGLYFSWLMWRFGSLWLTIALHALYNLLQFAALMLIDLSQPA